jgi:hypothetical protein
MLEKEFQYYRDHQKELVTKYRDKYIVIIEENVVGAYDSELEAYNKTKANHQVGTFLIQLCSDDPDVYTQTFHSRVNFS